jgi:hypothetical protein
VSRSKPTGVRFVYGDAVDRHGLSALAMTSGAFYHEDSKETLHSLCHCEEVTKLATRQSIVSRVNRVRVCGSITVMQ